MPKLIIYAGINGAGKTTLCNFHEIHENFEIVNADMILVEEGGDWKSKIDQIRAGKETLRRIKQDLAQNKSFSIETTRLSTFALNTAIKAKEKNYEVILNFIGVESLETALQRIEKRVQLGGHGIDKEVVKIRFKRQYEGLSQLISVCDKSFLYDNRDQLSLIGVFFEGNILYINKNIDWLKNFYENEHLSYLMNRENL